MASEKETVSNKGSKAPVAAPRKRAPRPKSPAPSHTADSRFQQMVDAAPNAMLMVGRDGTITFANAQTERLFGYRKDELLGSSVDLLVPERFRSRHPSHRAGFFQEMRPRSMGAGRDLYGLRKDGTEVPIEIGLNPINTPEGSFVLAAIVDITERKRAEDRLRQMIDAAPNAMLMVGRDGVITLINAQTEKLFGFRKDELLGRSVDLLVPERFRSRHPSHRTGFFQEMRPRSMGAGRDLYGLRKDGTEVPIEIGLNPINTAEGSFVLAAIVDITERKRAEEVQERYRQMVEAVKDYEIIMLDGGGKVVTWNAGAERLKGYRAEDVVGQHFSMFYAPEDVRAGKPEHELRAAAQGRFEDDGWRVRKDGSRFWANTVLAPLRDKNGALLGFAGVARDLTERRQQEERKSTLIATIKDAVQRLSTGVTEILASSAEQASGAAEQAAAVRQTIATVDEVLQTADQSAQRARGMAEQAQRTLEIGKTGRRAVEDTTSSMDAVKEQVESLAESILALAEQAQAIGEIIATVKDIAEQTNLLALNAAIEASRAGEHGRGFSVVASEVKALADQSKKATAQVRQILGEIQKATNAAVMATEDGTKSVNAAMRVVSQAGDTIRMLAETLERATQSSEQIAASAAQQATGMTQIHQAMKNIDQVATQTMTATRQTERTMQDLNQAGSRLRELVQSYGE
jgi:PAS domain S-box-containing protein